MHLELHAVLRLFLAAKFDFSYVGNGATAMNLAWKTNISISLSLAAEREFPRPSRCGAAGIKVALVERGPLGGTCPHPRLHSVETARLAALTPRNMRATRSGLASKRPCEFPIPTRSSGHVQFHRQI